MTTRVREDPALAAAAPPLESGMDHAATASLLSTLWDDSVLPALSEFIAVESQSPLFDPEWETNGLLDKSVAILVEWVRAQKVEGLTVEVRPPPLTPHPTPDGARSPAAAGQPSAGCAASAGRICARAHARHLHRGRPLLRRRRSRHRPALRARRHPAPLCRMVGWPVSLQADAEGRQAVWPRGVRRRLLDLRGGHRDHGPQGPGTIPPPATRSGCSLPRSS